MGVRFKKTADGEVAILPRDEYEALRARAAEADEDAGTARLVARARKQAASEVLIPKSVIDRIAKGDHPLRVFREWRDVTQLELMYRTDISQSHISDIETGRRVGTTETLKRLAGVLKVPLDLLA